MSYKQLFISNFFQFLVTVDYAVLKYTENNISCINKYSDVDLAFPKKHYPKIFKYISKDSLIRKYKVYQSSFMSVVYIFFHDNSFLEIDLIHKFIRKDIEYLRIDCLLNSVKFNHEKIKLPSIEYQFEYIYLFYILNGSNIELKYQLYFDSLPDNDKNTIANYFYNKYTTKSVGLSDLYVFNKNHFKQVVDVIKKQNSILKRIENIKNYFLDLLTNIKKSMVISFGYVDEEKMGFLSEAKELLEKKYRRNVVIIDYKSLVHCLTGQWIIYLKCRLKGSVIIFFNVKNGNILQNIEECYINNI